MADNLQPDAGEEREVSTSGLLLSAEPLQDSTGYRLSASGDRVPSADSEADDVNFDSDEDGDGDNGDDDSDADGGGPPVIEVGGTVMGDGTGDSDNGDSDNGDDSDADDSDSDR